MSNIIRGSRPDMERPAPGVWERPTRGPNGAPVAIICDAQSLDALRLGTVMSPNTLKWFSDQAVALGFQKGDVKFYGLCPPFLQQDEKSDARKKAFVESYVSGYTPGEGEDPALARKALVDEVYDGGHKLIVTFGANATRVMLGKPTAITKVRGRPILRENLPPVIPMLSPGFVQRIPDHIPTFQADLGTLSRIRAGGWDVNSVTPQQVDYKWCDDLSELLANKPRVCAIDTETTGLIWWQGVRVLTTQITLRPGHAIILPMSWKYIERHREAFDRILPGLTQSKLAVLRAQLKTFLEDPMIKKIGHNIKYEHQMLLNEGIDIKGWMHDTQLMAFFADENMMDKALDTITRVFVPDMSGYSDEFDRLVDKNRMIDVPPEDVFDEDGKLIQPGMRNYGCGDTDATYRNAKALDTILRNDARQYACYRKIQFSTLLCFAKVAERYGILIDQEHLHTFGQEVSRYIREQYRQLMRLVPADVKRYCIANNEDMSFTRPDFIRRVLFHKNMGFKLKPVVFTESTRDLQDKALRVPSTSTKDHLPFFTDRDDEAGRFCLALVEWVKAEKLLNTYIGTRDEQNGFWQYIASDGAIYPSYKLHATNTGRTASENPNGQNFPKRGRFAKAYNKVFKARPGHKFISADLSQIEIRIAAWMANETTMIDIYRNDGDIHTETAINSMGIARAAWDATPHGIRKDNRTKAKAINFGFLYGMQHKGFKDYAKTNYGVNYTEEEALTARTRFFTKYRALENWHVTMKEFARKHGYVRALHGAVRHLPGMFSNDRSIVSLTERQAVNAPVQRFGSDLGLMGMVRFTHQALPEFMRIIAFIHDALVMEVKDGYEEEAMSALLYAMENPPLGDWFGIEPPLPIKAEADIGLNFGAMIEMAELPSNKETGGLATPDWFNDLNLPTKQVNGVWMGDVKGIKPSWWNDNEREAETHFLYELETRPNQQIVLAA